MTKKLKGVPVRVDLGLELTFKTEEFWIVKPVDTWVEVSLSTTCISDQYRHIPVVLDSYSMVDLVSISFIKSLGMSPCNKRKHQHRKLMVKGISRMESRTYRFFHLRLCISDQWNCSIQFTRPFLAVNCGSHNSQVLLGRPMLKDLSISIHNLNDY